jgi:uncharacterized membrane protein YcaP (DUF421 family)
VLFETWDQLARVGLSALITYLALVLVLRLSGKRTLAKLNAFDLVVTVAVGSVLGATALDPGATVSEGVVALGALVGAQYAVAWTSTRFGSARRLAKSSPTLLLERGRVHTHRLREQRVTVGEIHQAVRASGLGDLGDAGAVVLETDGSLSVIPMDRLGDASALDDLGQRRPAGSGRSDG